MADERWISDEPRLAFATRLVIARALHRPVLVLVVALFVAGAFVASRVLNPPGYVATLHYRIQEGALSDPRHAPRAPPGIGDYIRNVAMSRDRVERLLKEHPSLGPSVATSRDLAIERFRDEVEIEVTRNYFILDWAPGDEPRSARVAVSLRARDGAEALGVLHEIGGTILQDQSEYRRAQVAGSREFIETQVQVARARVNALQHRLGQLQGEPSRRTTTRDGRNLPQIAALQGEARAATGRLVELERLAAASRLTAAAEQQDLGLTFELFDESVVPSGIRLTPLKLAALGTLAFGIALLITLIVVGTFDDRVYAPADLASHGLPVFGALPRFPGDDAWTYRRGMRSREK
jgi:hypothetical protein